MARLLVVAPEDEAAVRAWSDPADRVVVSIKNQPGTINILTLPITVEHSPQEHEPWDESPSSSPSSSL